MAGRRTNAAIHPTTPINMTTSAGTSVKFGCKTSSSSKIRWNFNSLSGDDRSARSLLPRVIYNGYRVDTAAEEKISVHSTTRQNDMTVLNVTTDDSGEYTCQEIGNDTEQRIIFYLIVEGTLFCKVFFSLKLNK